MKRSKQYKRRRWLCPLCKTNVKESPRDFKQLAREWRVSNNTYNLVVAIAEHAYIKHHFDIPAGYFILGRNFDRVIVNHAMAAEFKPIEPEYFIHHIDGDPTNNSTSNVVKVRA